MSNPDKSIRVGISCGDLNGVGMEVILKTFSNTAMLEMCTPVLFASSKVVSYHRKALELNELKYHTVQTTADALAGKFNIVQSWNEAVDIELGKDTAESGEWAYRSFEAAMDAFTEGHVDVLVTAPVNKHNINKEGRKFSGHTGSLGERFKGDPLMILVGDSMRVGLVTGHIPINEISKAITTDAVVVKIRQLHDAMERDFSIRRPRIAVLGLNPHAGDRGLIGGEDIKIIEPAVKTAFEKGVTAFGPFPADGFFGSGAWQKYDAVLAMYHDQGLIPFKTLHFSDGVNFTANLSVVRTSPDHGTAFDIAGKGKADENSFRQAVYLACDVYRNRLQNKEITENPLAFGKTQRDYR